MLKCLKQRANKVVVQFSIMQKGLDTTAHLLYVLKDWIHDPQDRTN